MHEQVLSPHPTDNTALQSMLGCSTRQGLGEDKLGLAGKLAHPGGKLVRRLKERQRICSLWSLLISEVARERVQVASETTSSNTAWDKI